jgi:hypothetical protein
VQHMARCTHTRPDQQLPPTHHHNLDALAHLALPSALSRADGAIRQHTRQRAAQQPSQLQACSGRGGTYAGGPSLGEGWGGGGGVTQLRQGRGAGPPDSTPETVMAALAASLAPFSSSR